MTRPAGVDWRRDRRRPDDGVGGSGGGGGEVGKLLSSDIISRPEVEGARWRRRQWRLNAMRAQYRNRWRSQPHDDSTHRQTCARRRDSVVAEHKAYGSPGTVNLGVPRPMPTRTYRVCLSRYYTHRSFRESVGRTA
jgi:hypothetical protein